MLPRACTRAPWDDSSQQLGLLHHCPITNSVTQISLVAPYPAQRAAAVEKLEVERNKEGIKAEEKERRFTEAKAKKAQDPNAAIFTEFVDHRIAVNNVNAQQQQQ